MSIFIEFMALKLRHKRFNNKSEQICDHSDLYTVNFSDIREVISIRLKDPESICVSEASYLMLKKERENNIELTI